MINEEFQKVILEQLIELKNDITAINAELVANRELNQSILHHTYELNAKFDNLLHAVVTKESLVNMAVQVESRLEHIEQVQITQAESIKLLVLRQFQAESDISVLKMSK